MFFGPPRTQCHFLAFKHSRIQLAHLCTTFVMETVYFNFGTTMAEGSSSLFVHHSLSDQTRPKDKSEIWEETEGWKALVLLADLLKNFAISLLGKKNHLGGKLSLLRHDWSWILCSLIACRKQNRACDCGKIPSADWAAFASLHCPVLPH